ncbi:MAG: DUF1465 family protein [Hyphomicrobiaceae bacterium]|nr:DUF1465 family protein [Hyphomicrobiaceae bacterium]
MSGVKSFEGQAQPLGVTISFGERFQRSEQFEVIFKEGMALVERTAAYLDGDGRTDARALKPPVSLAYASESMRLTTRLLELASWLLIRRALREGEISKEEAALKRRRLRLTTIGRPSHVKHFADLPETLRGLIEQSFALHDRIVQLDRALAGNGQPAPTHVAAAHRNPVEQQMSRLAAAFAGGGGGKVAPLRRI